MTLTASSVVLKQKKYLPVHGVSTRANKHVQISSSVERMVLQGGSTLEENETNDADTFIIHYTAVCLHFRLNRLLYT